ncbi:hypothetical protein QL285_038966 [Trifolium repens]|nr:hypothetical protein QL285_038966 [Trifolium repens]
MPPPLQALLRQTPAIYQKNHVFLIFSLSSATTVPEFIAVVMVISLRYCYILFCLNLDLLFIPIKDDNFFLRFRNGELSLSKLQATVIHVSVVAKEVTGLSQSKGDNVFIKYTDGFHAKNPVDGLYAFDMPPVDGL